jgi:formylglycine-generating enzyme required for sulfatase activity
VWIALATLALALLIGGGYLVRNLLLWVISSKETASNKPNPLPSVEPTKTEATKPTPTPTPAPTPSPNTVNEITNSVGMKFVLIPAGSFLMGSSDSDTSSGYYDNIPQHRVTFVKPFYIGRYKMTQGQCKTVMKSNPSSYKLGDNYPVNAIDWNVAQSLIRKLNELNDGYAYRLPSEAEWEYACRAGTTGEYAGDVKEMTKRGEIEYWLYPVGETKPNAWGLYDMHGNEEEWCADVWHYNYKGAPTDGSAWTSGGIQAWRVLRGGRSDERQEAKIIDPFGGLRVVAVPKQ